MKSNIPWSVKGIDPEAREAAKVAARRAGMTLGEWLNSLILQSGELPEGFAQQIGALIDEEDDESDLEEDGLTESSDAPDELQSRIDNLNRKLDQSDRQALAAGGIDESIERLASTIESSRRLLASGENAQKSIADLAHRVERIQSRVEEVAQQHRSGIDPRTLMALERAIAGVASHIEKSDRRNTELVQSVESALGQLGARVDGAETTATDAAARMDIAFDRLGARVDGAQATASEAVARIDVTLDRLGNRLETTEAEQRRNAARLNERLSQVDDRLAHNGVEREAILASIERRLAGFETKLQTVQVRVDSAATGRPNMPPDVMTRVEFEDWSRRQSIDLGADTGSIKRSVATIEARLSGVMERIDRVRNETEGQIKDVERKAEDALRQGQIQFKASDGQTAVALGDLRSTVDEIAQKFDRTNHTTTETMSALEGVLRSLTRRLDALEGRPNKPIEVTPPAPAQPEPEPTPTAAAALPKRPTWSWGVPQQGPAATESRLPPEPATVIEPEPTAPPRVAALASGAADERSVSGRHGLDDTLEVYEDKDDAAGTTHTEDNDVEVTFAPDGRTSSEPTEVEAEPVEEGQVDLSKLVFNLDTGRDSDESGSDWRRDDKWRDAHGRAEPTIDVEPVEEETSPASAPWLDQARRAAKAAGHGERVGDFAIEGEERNSTRAFVIVLIVLLVFMAVAAIGWIFVRPWLAKSHLLGGTHAGVEQTAPSNQPARAPAPPGPTGNLSPLTAPEAAPPGANPSQPGSSTQTSPTQDVTEPGYTPPSETDIGPPLPGEEAPETPTTPPAAAGAPSAAPTGTPGTPNAAPTPEGAPAIAQTQPGQTPGATTPPAAAPQAPVSAEDAMQAAATSGNPRALYASALAHKNGRGVATNVAQALSMMKQAADKNLAVAQRTLGIWYEQGDGVDKNIGEARVWYEKAANNGDVQAMHNLGFFYAQGMGGLKRDGDAAEKWFKNAADKGLVASQVNLAIINSQSASYGLPSQNDQAYFWSAVAAKRDPSDTDAPRMRDALGGALSAEVKSQMDEAIAKWKPKAVDIIANGGFDSSPEAFLPAEQQPALSRAEMTSVQEMLNELGYSAGTADGRPGAQTETAIKAFQAAYGLPQTGTANRELLAALNAIPH